MFGLTIAIFRFSLDYELIQHKIFRYEVSSALDNKRFK